MLTTQRVRFGWKDRQVYSSQYSAISISTDHCQI